MTPAKAAMACSVLLLSMIAATAAQFRSPEDLVSLLRQGGYVLVMRHASSPREIPTKEQADPGNLKLERQLDESGRRTASAMGDALRRLQIPIGDVLTSPTYRAMQTATLAGLDRPQAVSELGDGGQSMGGVSEAQITWLRNRVTEVPRSGNTFLVTHQPNLSRAFPELEDSVAEGECVVLRPDGRGGFVLVGRIPIDEWPRLGR